MSNGMTVNAVEMDERTINLEVLPPREKFLPNGYVVNRFEEYLDMIWMEVSLAGTYASKYRCRCPKCGSTDLRIRGSETRIVRDLPYFGRNLTWELKVPELQCMGECRRKSFVPELSGMIDRNTNMTVRLKEFILFLACCTSSEGASRILEYMVTDISGDTVERTKKSYKYARRGPEQDVWKEADQFSEKAIRRISEEQAEEFAYSLAYHMNQEILHYEREVRLREMVRLFDIVFVKRRVCPRCRSTNEGIKEERPGFTFAWKEDIAGAQ